MRLVAMATVQTVIQHTQMDVGPRTSGRVAQTSRRERRLGNLSRPGSGAKPPDIVFRSAHRQVRGRRTPRNAFDESTTAQFAGPETYVKFGRTVSWFKSPMTLVGIV